MTKQGTSKQGDRISEVEVRVYRQLADEWLTNAEIAAQLGVAERTARVHTRRFAEEGIAECQRLFPAFRYRRVSRPPKSDYWRRLSEAAAVFGHG